MSNLEKLQKKIDDMVATGLTGIRVTTGDLTNVSPEIFAGEMLNMLSAIENGLCTPLRFNDSKRKGV